MYILMFDTSSDSADDEYWQPMLASSNIEKLKAGQPFFDAFGHYMTNHYMMGRITTKWESISLPEWGLDNDTSGLDAKDYGRIQFRGTYPVKWSDKLQTYENYIYVIIVEVPEVLV